MGSEVLNLNCRISRIAGSVSQDVLGIVGNAQDAAATTRRGMRPSVLLVLSPINLATHGAGEGCNALDHATVLTGRQTD